MGNINQAGNTETFRRPEHIITELVEHIRVFCKNGSIVIGGVEYGAEDVASRLEKAVKGLTQITSSDDRNRLGGSIYHFIYSALELVRDDGRFNPILDQLEKEITTVWPEYGDWKKLNHEI